jgi:hypothetical protein
VSVITIKYIYIYQPGWKITLLYSASKRYNKTTKVENKVLKKDILGKYQQIKYGIKNEDQKKKS